MLEAASHGDPPRPLRSLDVAITTLLVALALAYFSISFTRTIDLEDEGLILHHSARALAGDLPYRDFPDVYAPGVFALTGLALEAADGRIIGVRLMLAAWKAAAVGATFLLVRRVAGRGFAILGALVAIAFWGRLSWNLNTPYASLFAIPLCLLASLALTRALRVDAAPAWMLAGLLGGTPVLFKQSLGLMNAVGMALAACAVTSLLAAPAERNWRGTAQFLAIWVVGAVVVIVPARPFLEPSDYLLHFLPLHVFMSVLAASVILRRGAPWLDSARRRLVPFAIGLAAPPALAAVTPIALGVRPQELVANLITLPLTYTNYYLPVPIPPLGRLLILVGVLGSISALLLALRGSSPGWILLGFGSVATLLAGVALLGPTDGPAAAGGSLAWRHGRAAWWTILAKTPTKLAGVESGLILLATALALAPALLDAGRRVDAEVVRVVIPLALCQAMLSYQVFPRGSINGLMLAGAVVPLLCILVSWWFRLGSAGGKLRSLVAAGLVALLPLWLALPVVLQLVRGVETRGDRRPLAMREVQGLSLAPRVPTGGHMEELESLRPARRGGAGEGSPAASGHPRGADRLPARYRCRGATRGDSRPARADRARLRSLGHARVVHRVPQEALRSSRTVLRRARQPGSALVFEESGRQDPPLRWWRFTAARCSA